MRRRIGLALAIGALLAAGVLAPTAGAGAAATPPGQPATGHGSSESYVSTGATRHVTGSGFTGTRVWWFEPHTLRNGSSAPVVVFLHGFQLLAPDIYQGHIDHLTRQGYVVIYPQFNRGGIFGLLSDTNQNQMLDRAISATNVALDRLGSKADRSDLHLYGHSLGGLMAGSWVGRGGPAPQSVTIANPSLDPSGAIPSFVSSFIRITPIDYRTASKANTARTIILTGDRDTIASPAEAVAFYHEMTNASSRVVYQAVSDDHGSPALVADHMAAIQDQGIVPNFMMQLFGGLGREDALDFRFYYAALDANLASETEVSFDPGTWSDGTPAAPPVQLAP